VLDPKFMLLDEAVRRASIPIAVIDIQKIIRAAQRRAGIGRDHHRFTTLREDGCQSCDHRRYIIKDGCIIRPRVAPKKWPRIPR